MPYSLGIKIGGDLVADVDAKIVGLMAMGLSVPETASVICKSEGTIYNRVSDMYAHFQLGKCPQKLIINAFISGFDTYCYVYGTDILDANERERLVALGPLVLQAKIRLCIILEPLKS